MNINTLLGINRYLDELEEIVVQEGDRLHQESLHFVSSVDYSLRGGVDSLVNRIMSLRYRLNLESRGEINPNICRALDLLLPDREGKSHKIEEASRYSLFAERLIKDRTIREEFFQWAIIFGNDIRPMIEFPATVRKIVQCGLGARIGFYGGSGLQVIDGDRKLLTLPFEGNPINILDPDQTIVFKNNYRLTLKQVYKIFSDRAFEMGNLEYLPSGICNWNPKKLALYNPLTNDYDTGNLKSEDWWNSLPWIRQLTVGEAEDRYKLLCDGVAWIFTIKASRENPSLQVEGTHTYLEVAIPNGWGYNIYYFGKFATSRFPTKTVEYLNIITAVLPAAVCYPDENIYNLHREHTGYPVMAEPHEGLAIMRSIKKDVLNGMQNNFYFQLINENCCKWVWKKLRHHLGEERVPDLFSMPFTELEGEGIHGKFFEYLRQSSKKKQQVILSSLFFVFGGWRKRKVIKKNGTTRKIGVFCSPCWHADKSVFHPPRLFSE